MSVDGWLCGHVCTCVQNIATGTHANDGDVKRLREAVSAVEAAGSGIALASQARSLATRLDAEVRTLVAYVPCRSLMYRLVACRRFSYSLAYCSFCSWLFWDVQICMVDCFEACKGAAADLERFESSCSSAIPVFVHGLRTCRRVRKYVDEDPTDLPLLPLEEGQVCAPCCRVSVYCG